MRERRTRRADIFRDRTRMEGERVCWQIELDRVVMATRDFVWLRLVIQTDDFHRGMPRSLFEWIIPTRGSHKSSPFTRFPGSSKARVIQPTARRVTPNGIGPPENANRHTTSGGLGAQYAPVRVCNGRDARSVGNHVRWSSKKLGHLLGCACINYRQVGSPSTRDSGDQVLAATSSVHPHTRTRTCRVGSSLSFYVRPSPVVSVP